MSQKTIYHNGKIATNSTPYFAEAMAVEDEIGRASCRERVFALV